MLRDWPDAYTMVCMYICREKRKPCEYANSNGYCKVTACVKQPEYVQVENIQPWQWMKSREK